MLALHLFFYWAPTETRTSRSFYFFSVIERSGGVHDHGSDDDSRRCEGKCFAGAPPTL